jgi:hypothetical protein
MGDGEYEFADDGKLFKPPTVKLLSAKLKSGPGKGVVSKNIISFLMEKKLTFCVNFYRVLHKESIWLKKVKDSTINIRPN